jgi:hypothetical protein
MPSWKKIILSGSDASLNSLSVSNGITGSLFGTSSWAVSASRALTSSYATITDSARYNATASNIDYPLAIFNGPIISSNQSNSGSFIIGAIDQPLYFNPNTGVLTTRTFSGALIGTASFAVTASHALNSPNITSGTAAPSGGNDGDIYLQYV